METYVFSVNVYMKEQEHACINVLLQLVLTFDHHWKWVYCLIIHVYSFLENSPFVVNRAHRLP